MGNKNLQLEKLSHKMNIITNLLNNIIDYNNIEGYENQKDFKIVLDYENKGNFYTYTTQILRGMHDPKEIFITRFNCYEKVNNNLIEMFEKLFQNENFLYTSFQMDIHTKKVINYCLNFKSGVIFSIFIRTSEELEFFNEVEERFKSKKIVVVPDEIFKTKDQIQKDKAIKTFSILKNIINDLEMYNSIEDYENIKPYKLLINNEYDYSKECNVFNFKIIRGNINPNVFLDLKVNIKNINVIYDLLYDFIYSFKNSQKYKSQILNISEKGNYYCLNLENNIYLYFNINNKNLKDIKFYYSIYDSNKEEKENKSLKKIKNDN